MHLSDLIELTKKKSEARLREMRTQLSLPYFRARDQAQWNHQPKNIVVVGSGIGGMAAGALFAKTGHRVTVLERHPSLIGGHGRCLTFGGMRYSMGPQYVWEFGEGQLGDRFMEFLGIKASNPFAPMQADGFERILIGDRRQDCNYCYVDFLVPLGLARFREALKDLFAEESDGIDALFSDMIAIFDTYKSFLTTHLATEGRFLTATKFLLTGSVPTAMKYKLGRTIYQSVKEFFDQYGLSPLLRRILYGHGGIFAENESDMSAIAYIIGTGNYHAGAWYPENGFYHFFDALAGVIEDSGGTVKTGRAVSRLETENQHVTRAVCEDGTSFDCDAVFSDISPRLTERLLKKSADAAAYDYTPSHSIPTCCIGVKGGLCAIADMKGRNFWWQAGREVDYHNADITAPPQMLFIGSPTANGFGKAPDNPDDALVVFCPGNYEQEKRIYEQGSAAVREFKDKLAADIVDILERNVFPGICNRLRFAEILSSVDIEADTAGETGNAYGRRLSVDEILKGPIREPHCPANLYNVSATKNSPGIAGGIATAEVIFRELTATVI